MKGIELTEKAEHDLKDIYQYGYLQYGEIKVDAYIKDLEKSLQFLAENPLIVRERLELKPPVRIHHHAKQNIIYQQTAEGILIIRLLHERMEIKNHL